MPSKVSCDASNAAYINRNRIAKHGNGSDVMFENFYNDTTK